VSFVIQGLIVVSEDGGVDKLVLRAPTSDFASIYDQTLGEEEISRWEKKGYREYYGRSKEDKYRLNYAYYKSMLPYRDKIYEMVKNIKCPVYMF